MRRLPLFVFALISLVGCETPSAPAHKTVAMKIPRAPSTGKLFNFSYVLSNSIYNPCPPEENVLFEGSLHYLATGEPETPTSSDYKFHFNMQGVEGIGEISGDRYHINQNDKSDVYFFFPPVDSETTFDARFRLIRQGSSDNLWIRITGLVTEDEEITVREEIECRG